jgi:DNA-binding GntR family transcriptional regulator
VPEYVLSLKGSDHHTAALDAIVRGDGQTAENEIAADIAEAAVYLGTLADKDGRLRKPAACA